MTDPTPPTTEKDALKPISDERLAQFLEPSKAFPIYTTAECTSMARELQSRRALASSGRDAVVERDKVIEEIAAERRRQVEVEGWSVTHDDQHGAGEMSNAAAAYALSGDGRTSLWPWDWKWWKPSGRRRDLVKAGALIVAEIERLDRALKGGKP